MFVKIEKMAELEHIKNLLMQVSGINKKYEEIAKITGENYNVFKVLGFTTKEVKLHSAFIADLLNPKGSHGMGDVFLKIFIRQLPDNIQKQITDTRDTIIEVEKWLGKIDNIDWTGGYIDILISFKNSVSIIIENKINALDQEGQLRRYFNFKQSASIIYLSLDGKKAIDYSTKNIEFPDKLIHPILFSYRENIKQWLEECIKETVYLPLLRETISQYVNIIRHLTHQTMENKEQEEIISKILSNGDYIEALMKIGDGNIYLQTKLKIIDNIYQRISELFSGKDILIDKGYLNGKEDLPLGTFDTGFWFYKASWKHCITFFFTENDSEKIQIVIENLENTNPIDGQIKNKIQSIMKDFHHKNITVIESDAIWTADFTIWDNTSWANVEKEIPSIIFDLVNMIVRNIE